MESKCNCAVEDIKELKVTIKPKAKNYSIIVASVPNFVNDTIYIHGGKVVNSQRAWGYLFNLPMTTLAWKRFGFRTITILTVDYNNIQPAALHLMKHVDKTLRRLNAVVFYFHMPSHMKVRLSQMLRLVGGQFDIVKDDDFLMTSDADLWPLDPRRYKINSGKGIYVNNMMCCGQFMFNGKKYREYPMSNIAMTGKLWRTVFNNIMEGEYFGNTYTYANIKPLLKRLETFANSSSIYTHKHGGKWWNLDQRYGSVVIQDYLNKVNNSIFQSELYIKCQRIIVDNWGKVLKQKHECLSDAHVFKTWPWRRWEELKQLSVQVFDNETVSLLDKYKREFVMIMEKKST